MPEITEIIHKLPRNPHNPNMLTRPVWAIRRIVVHYDAVPLPFGGAAGAGYDPVARYKAQALYHIAKDWNEGSGPPVPGFGLMYHYRVSGDGRLWCTQPE